MIIEIRHYTYYPSEFRPFLKFYADEGFAITSKHLGKTIGIMTGISGVANRTFQFFAYESYAHRLKCRQAFLQDPTKQKFTDIADKAIIRQESILIEPIWFSPLFGADKSEPVMAKENGQLRYFDLTTFETKPGKRQELLQLMASELTPLYQKYFPYEIGYFIKHYDDIDSVIALWAFDSEEQRMDCMNALEHDEAYQKIIPHLSNLIYKRNAQLLQPTVYSPLR